MAAVLTGFKYKAEQLALAKALDTDAKASEKEARDAQYKAQCAAADAELLTAVAGRGPAVCGEHVAQARARIDELRAIEKPTREDKGNISRLTREVATFAPLAAGDADGCREAIAAATEAATLARQAAEAARARADQRAQQAATALATAKTITDLPAKGWARDQTADDRSLRGQEADLFEMQADLNALGGAAPPGATTYCAALQASVDQAAHRVPCARCAAAGGPTEHALARSAPAKAALAQLFTRLEGLAALGEVEAAALDAASQRDRLIGVELERLRRHARTSASRVPMIPGVGGAPDTPEVPAVAGETPGKMIGVLLCTDGSVYQAFSGDIHGDDDVAGWATHIPPVGPGSALRSANGVAVPLTALPDVTGGTPHGVCAAPKLIQQAYRDGKTPAALAEAWYGKNDKGKFHGGLVASCSTCMKNLDVQLCHRVEAP